MQTAEAISTLLVEVKISVATFRRGLARSAQIKIHLPYDSGIFVLRCFIEEYKMSTALLSRVKKQEIDQVPTVRKMNKQTGIFI